MSVNETEIQKKRATAPIAIVGMAGIFPEARTISQFWDNIVRRVDCIRDVPPSRWDIADYYDPNPNTPDKTYCRRGGFIPDVEFDPLSFGLPPNILEAVDVAQLLALVVAKEALADAGYAERAFARQRTGVVLGISMAQQSLQPLISRLQYPILEKVLRSRGFSEATIADLTETFKLAYPEWEEDSFPGFLNNVVSGRVANRLDLGGLNCAVDAACASSLSALKIAVSELAEYHCDMMLAGGVDLDNSIITYMSFSKTPAFSKKGETHPFDSSADGMIASEGIGIVVLKRLADAERDGDRIYAVLKGIGSSSDGRYKSIYAPRPEGQARALQAAYQHAGISPATVGLIEAHGTGTVAGDLCEVTSLTQVLNEVATPPQTVALGSVKSQIGHTKAAAGIASLIKIALALHHQILPPTIGITQPNPKLALDQSPLYLNTQTRPWLSENPRRAGISSFGFGGINYHAVLEEYQTKQPKAYRYHSTAQTILLAAPNVAQLIQKAEQAIQRWQANAGQTYYNQLVADSRRELGVPEQPRIGLIVTSLAEAIDLLGLAINQLKQAPDCETWEHSKAVYYRRRALPMAGRVVALFAGQGSQYLEMGRELALNFPEIRQAYQEMDKLFHQDKLIPLSELVFPKPAFDEKMQKAQTSTLQQTEHAQPAIGVFSAALYRLLQQAGFQANFVAGHSFGELTALWAAGVLDDTAYFNLVKARGRVMAAPANQNDYDTGTMLAVRGELSELQDELAQFPTVVMANHNTVNQVVLAGAKPVMAEVQKALQAKSYSVMPLPVSAAFHTPLVEFAQKPFAQVLEQTIFQTPNIPVYSNTTAQSYPTEPDAIRQTLAQHMLKPVLFRQEIEAIYAAGGFCFVEFGPRDILTNLVKEILGDRPHLAVALNASRQKDSDYQLRQAVLQLRVSGLAMVDFDAYSVPLPDAPKTAKANSIRLNGSQYVSPQTKEAFEKALQNNSTEKSNGTVAIVNQPASQLNAGLAQSLEQLTRQQTEMAHVQQQFLTTQLEFFKNFTQMMSQQQASLVQLQSQYLSNQAAYFNNLFQLMQQPSGLSHYEPQAINNGLPTKHEQPAINYPISNNYKPATPEHFQVVSTQPPTLLVNQTSGLDIAKLLLAAISAKTGYPTDGLELEMEIEADLGVDSIKLIEILTGLHEQYSNLPLISPEEIGKLRTLRQIANYLSV